MRIFIIGLSITFLLLAGCSNGQRNKAPNVSKSVNSSHEEVEKEEVGLSENEEVDLPANEEVQNEETSEALQDKTMDKEFISQFFGEWRNKDERDILLTLEEGSELLGVEDGQLLSSSEFSVTEANKDEQYIIIQGLQEDIEYDEENPKVDFSSKIILNHDGKELTYIYDYLNEKQESRWVK